MSAAVETQPPPNIPQTMTEPPRKRKKRASAVGAAVDCFTCSSRNLKCDRRRPYCSQCLDAGQDCSGYKTQLTWGVGVASRGKLRGLSLPVAGTQKAAEPTSPPKSKKRRESQISEETTTADHKTSPVSPLTSPNTLPEPAFQTFAAQTSPVTPITAGYISQQWPSGPSSTMSTSPQAIMGSEEYRLTPIGYGDPSQVLPGVQSQIPYQQPQQHYQPPPTSNPSNLYVSQVAPNLQFGGPVDIIPNQHSNQFMENTSPSDASSNSSALPKTPAYYSPVQKDEPRWQDLRHHDSIPKSVPAQMVNIAENYNEEDDVEEINRDFSDECAVVDTVSASSLPFVQGPNWPMVALSSTNGVGRDSRMKYLINYYAEVISPVIVAFDGPNNPFRNEVLSMALKSETLQHAISALSASNIRRRQESGGQMSTGKTIPTRRASMAHQTLTDENYVGPVMLSLEDQIREETFHKRVAVQQLNKQLADRNLRQNDAVLATLLILSLFDMCDSGVANFSAQFSGVKKLLALRGDELGLLNPEAKWMTRMFAWYDAFSATVNDREAQFASYKTDPGAFSGDWSFSNLAGIDGQLFSTIARLGRLNSLVQGRTVTPAPATTSKPVPSMPTTNENSDQFDGNGWMRILEDEDLFSSKTQTYDLSTQFWQEWREVRHNLQTWTMPFMQFRIDGSEDQSLTPAQRLDCENVSEAFRYAALLYTERLANPTIPSSDERIQFWVRKSLDYIQLAQSDTYLLWPVFVTGAECVDEVGRDIVRGRARDIQRDSGFVNNASCLEILEKVWRRGETAYELVNDVYNLKDVQVPKKSAFIFRDVMLNEVTTDGEYFVL